MEFITEQPIWFLVFCALFGLGGAWLLYRHKRTWTKEFSKSWAMALFTLRALTISLLTALLLNPLLKINTRLIEKPALFIGVDNSKSMLAGTDSIQLKQNINRFIDDLKSEVGMKYEIIVNTFGKNVNANNSLSFNQETTNISRYFTQLEELYGGNNPFASILITDGIVNRGVNPLYVKHDYSIPCFTIGVGDSSIKKDLKILDARLNSIAFLGNSFPLEVDIESDLCKDITTKLLVKIDGKLVFEKSIGITKNYEQTSHRFKLQSKKIGVHKVDLILRKTKGEQNVVNNIKTLYVEVIDGRQKILLLAEGPHPDIAALKNTIQNVDQYELEVLFRPDNIPDLKPYDLVITHQYPANEMELIQIEKIKKSQKPLWMILGAQTNINVFNRAKLWPKFSGNTNNINHVGAYEISDFSLFKIDNNQINQIKNWPPLIVPFGEMSMPNMSYVFLSQQIGSVKTKLPLWAFSNSNNYKKGLLLGEGIWRWKITENEENGNSNLFNSMVRSTIQYLALKEDKRKFKVYSNKQRFLYNEPIIISAELYNQSLEPVLDADVELKLKDENGKVFVYKIPASLTGYELTLKDLQSGSYTYVASTNYGGQTFKQNGRFIIEPIELEFSNTVADFTMLRKLSKLSGGEFYRFNNSRKLLDLLNNSKAQSYSSLISKYKDIIDQKWIFYILLFLFSFEWFVRRYFGTY